MGEEYTTQPQLIELNRTKTSNFPKKDKKTLSKKAQANSSLSHTAVSDS